MLFNIVFRQIKLHSCTVQPLNATDLKIDFYESIIQPILATNSKSIPFLQTQLHTLTALKLSTTAQKCSHLLTLQSLVTIIKTFKHYIQNTTNTCTYTFRHTKIFSDWQRFINILMSQSLVIIVKNTLSLNCNITSCFKTCYHHTKM